MLHFIGFRGDEYYRAIRVFGQPDFVHKFFDGRVREEADVNDTFIFANGSENKFTKYNWDASSAF
jgi:hypothetical protein